MASTQAPKREAASAGRIEGESSSEESESEERAYKSGRQEILQTAERVFGDASEEYSQLGNVKQRLEAWKQDHGTDTRMPIRPSVLKLSLHPMSALSSCIGILCMVMLDLTTCNGSCFFLTMECKSMARKSRREMLT